MHRVPENELMDLQHEAQAYAQADFSHVNQAFVDQLLELTGPLSAASALDLGTGPADIPIRLLRGRPQWKIVALDASPAMLALAQQAVTSAGVENSITLICADAKATGLPSGAFNVIFSNSILHHLADIQPFWLELKRLAAPGAVIFLRDLARPATVQEARKLVDHYAGGESPLLQEEYFRSLLAAYTTAEVHEQLRQAGIGHLHVQMVTDRHLDVFGQLA